MTTKDVKASSVAEVKCKGWNIIQSSKKTAKDIEVSKEMVNSFKVKLTRIELSLGDMHEHLDTFDGIVVKCETNDVVGVKSQLQHAFNAFVDSMKLAMNESREMMLAQIDDMKVKLREIW